MIDKREILEAASSFSLLPSVVEKDYVLGWIIAGIYAHEELTESWIFKGGTCLKKCYFETYRFSEDLDFTVPKGAIYNEAAITSALGEAAVIVYEEAGIEIKPSEIELQKSFNKKGAETYVAKLTY